MLAELQAELEQINEATMAVERIAAGSGKRRGRPPRWLAAVRNGKPERKSTKAATKE